MSRKKVEIFFGPPGCGKTYKLLNILETELEKIKPDRVAYLSFTRVARREAKERAMWKFGFSAKELPYFRTLHSICYELLGLNPANIITSPEQLSEFGRQQIFEFGFQKRSLDDDMNDWYADPDTRRDGDAMMNFYTWMRHKMYDFDKALYLYPEKLHRQAAIQFVREYEKYKRKEDLLDFSDFLSNVDRPLDVDVIFVDEAQDLSDLQWKAFHTISQRAKRIYIAGDDDQAIFEWSGASPETFIKIRGKKEVLAQSFRMPRNVHDYAQKIVRRIKTREPKEFYPRDADGLVKDFYWDIAQLPLEKPTSDWEHRLPWRILVRANYQKLGIQIHLNARGIPYTVNGKERAVMSGVRAAVYWKMLQRGEHIPITDAQLIYKFASSRSVVQMKMKSKMNDEVAQNFDRKISLSELRNEFGLVPNKEYNWEQVLTLLKKEDKATVSAILEKTGEEGVDRPWLDLSTIHGAKGSEATNVVLLGEMPRKVKENSASDSEKRVWYVGATRAYENLFILKTYDNPILPVVER